MSHDQITVFFFSLALLLATARLLGEAARHFRQPAVLGEILAGIILGPTVFGALRPDLFQTVFPSDGPNAIALHAVTTLCVVLFLLVAGLEIDLSIVFRLWRSAAIIGLCGLLLPFGIGFGLGQTVPGLVGMEPGADRFVFSLFLGVALAISALPVIAKTLIDLRLFRTDIGMIIMAVAIFHDLVGWMIFAVILALMAGEAGAGAGGLGTTIILTLVYTALMLTVGRRIIDRILPWFQAHTSWPGGVLGLSVTLALFGAAFTEYIGIHAIFGAFIVGVALGDSPHLLQKTRSVIEEFVSSIFAPIFFASIGLKVNFITHFDATLVAIVLVVACVGETLGCAFGAMWAGFPKRQSWAIGFALNARGAMEIVLASLALQYGVIGERLFVALVIMALVTSLIAGPLMQRVLDRKTAAKLRDFLRPQCFLPSLRSTQKMDVVREMCDVAAQAAGLPAETLFQSVWKREETMSTGFPGGVAIPHGKIDGLKRPIVVVGISETGVEFNSTDGLPARLIVMVLASPQHSQSHLEILADVAGLIQDPATIAEAAAAANYTKFLAVLNIRSQPAENA